MKKKRLFEAYRNCTQLLALIPKIHPHTNHNRLVITLLMLFKSR